jgi:hypothetical protein
MTIDMDDIQNLYTIVRLSELFQQRNLVYNCNFLYFSNMKKSSSKVEWGHPDGWIYSDPGSGAQIGLDKECCRIVTSNDETSIMTFKQALHEFPRWESTLLGKNVSASVNINLGPNTSVKVSLTDGISSADKIETKEGDTVIRLSLKVDENAEGLYISIESSINSGVIKISKVYANVGTIAIDGLPCIVKGVIGERKQYISTQNPPAEELSLCEEKKELGSNYTRLNSVLNKRFGEGPNKRSMLPDIRGYFSRSWNNSSDIDPDASNRQTIGDGQRTGDFVGTIENDAFFKHSHQLDFTTIPIFQGTAGTTNGLNTMKTSKTDETGGEETRPKNFSELYTIRWA